MSLQSGLNAFQEGRYQESVKLLEQFCRNCVDQNSSDYLSAQMWLVKAYQGAGELEKATIMVQKLMNSNNPEVRNWAQQARQTLPQTPPASQSQAFQTAGRAATAGVKLAMGGVGGSLVLASGVTMTLMFGMVLALGLSLVLILGSNDPLQGLAIAIGITIIFSILSFFLSPFLMDLIQSWLYQTRWVELAEVESLSPETARIIHQVCQQKQLKTPRLGIINDQNPTAFTYGSLPNSARLVVSQGLFTYLDDDEIATVYAHELGHIVHWDFAVMTVASTLVQICYLIYSTARRLTTGDDSKIKDAIQSVALAAYIFYILGTYLLLYLSRTREYFADHFAAETTGNPNGLSRALVKIAYGIVEEGSRSKEPSRLIEGTRALGIYDPKAAASTGTAYRIASDSQKIGRVFLWDMFNPWGWWMELNSTHPLTGKRVRALSTYAEQLGLPIEFDMGRVINEGKTLSKGKLYGNFLLDVVLYGSETIGLLAGLVIAAILWSSSQNPGLSMGAPFIGLGVGIVIKALVMFPSYQQAPATDVLTLMSDPYASPLRGQPAKLEGQLIGRGDAGYKFGSDLKIQDRSGMLYLHYASRFGPIGNFLFGMKRVQSLIGQQVEAVGWFRRGVAPWMDLIQLQSENGTIVNSYHRFWSFIMGGALMILGVVVQVYFR
ncbi:MAG: M48 family metalloprotease [Gloeotrichia echinulata DVL01]|jgi:Zn-dependent protease with chaperone function